MGWRNWPAENASAFSGHRCSAIAVRNGTLHTCGTGRKSSRSSSIRPQGWKHLSPPEPLSHNRPQGIRGLDYQNTPPTRQRWYLEAVALYRPTRRASVKTMKQGQAGRTVTTYMDACRAKNLARALGLTIKMPGTEVPGSLQGGFTSDRRRIQRPSSEP